MGKREMILGGGPARPPSEALARVLRRPIVPASLAELIAEVAASLRSRALSEAEKRAKPVAAR